MHILWEGKNEERNHLNNSYFSPFQNLLLLLPFLILPSEKEKKARILAKPHKNP